jgi:hypothetical protein
MGPLLALGGAVAFLGLRYLVRKDVDAGLVELRNAPSPTLPTGPAAPLPPQPVSQGPEHITDAVISLAPGGRYLASVDVVGSTFISRSRVASEAAKQGFADTVVSTSPPAGLPPVKHGDFYVVGTYSGAPRTIGRSQAGGIVTLVDGWRIG